MDRLHFAKPRLCTMFDRRVRDQPLEPPAVTAIATRAEVDAGPAMTALTEEQRRYVVSLFEAPFTSCCTRSTMTRKSWRQSRR